MQYMPTIFIDESGNFSQNTNLYFVVASFSVGNPRRAEKQFRSWQNSKFPRKLRNTSEVKFSEPGIDAKLREKTLIFLANLDIRICYSYLKLSNIPDQYRHKGRLREGHLYAHIIAETIKTYLPPTDGDLRVFCDQRSLKGLPQRVFIKDLVDQFHQLVPTKTLLEIRMIDSTKTANMQIVDWIAGGLAARLNGMRNGEKYYQHLKDRIVSEQELFRITRSKHNKKPDQY